MLFRSFGIAIITAMCLMSSAAVFGQMPDGKGTDTVSAIATSDKSLTGSAEKIGALSTIAKHTPDKANNKNDKDDTTEAVDAAAIKPAASDSGKWQFGFAPYLFLTGISGTVGVRGRTATIDQSIGDVLSHFRGGFMGTFVARKGRFVMADDLLWVKLIEERDTPGGLYDTGKVSINMTIFDPQAGIRVVDKKAGSFDVFGGVRVTTGKMHLSFTSGVLPGFDVEQRKTWAAPTIGARGMLNLSPKIYVSSLFDVGGGFGTNVTGQFYAGMGYRIKPRVAMLFGYHYLKNDYSDDNGFVFDASMSGLVLGAMFRF